MTTVADLDPDAPVPHSAPVAVADVRTRANVFLQEHPLPDRASKFQLTHFVAGAEPTPAGQFWTIVRNVADRRTQLHALSLELDDLSDDVELAEIAVQRAVFAPVCGNSNPLEEYEQRWAAQEQEIAKRKTARRVASLCERREALERKQTALVEELEVFLHLAEKLQDQGAGVAPFDDPQEQLDYWNAKFTEQVNTSVLLNRPVTAEMARTIMSLPDEAPVKQQLCLMFRTVRSVSAAASQNLPAPEKSDE